MQKEYLIAYVKVNGEVFAGEHIHGISIDQPVWEIEFNDGRILLAQGDISVMQKLRGDA